MAYKFETEATGSFKFNSGENAGNTMTLNGINAKTNDATGFSKGIAGLFWIGNAEWETEEGIRTVKQTVKSE